MRQVTPSSEVETHSDTVKLKDAVRAWKSKASSRVVPTPVAVPHAPSTTLVVNEAKRQRTATGKSVPSAKLPPASSKAPNTTNPEALPSSTVETANFSAPLSFTEIMRRKEEERQAAAAARIASAPAKAKPKARTESLGGGQSVGLSSGGSPLPDGASGQNEGGSLTPNDLATGASSIVAPSASRPPTARPASTPGAGSLTPGPTNEVVGGSHVGAPPVATKSMAKTGNRNSRGAGSKRIIRKEPDVYATPEVTSPPSQPVSSENPTTDGPMRETVLYEQAAFHPNASTLSLVPENSVPSQVVAQTPALDPGGPFRGSSAHTYPSNPSHQPSGHLSNEATMNDHSPRQLLPQEHQDIASHRPSLDNNDVGKNTFEGVSISLKGGPQSGGGNLTATTLTVATNEDKLLTHQPNPPSLIITPAITVGPGESKDSSPPRVIKKDETSGCLTEQGSASAQTAAGPPKAAAPQHMIEDVPMEDSSPSRTAYRAQKSILDGNGTPNQNLHNPVSKQSPPTKPLSAATSAPNSAENILPAPRSQQDTIRGVAAEIKSSRSVSAITPGNPLVAKATRLVCGSFDACRNLAELETALAAAFERLHEFSAALAPTPPSSSPSQA